MDVEKEGAAGPEFAELFTDEHSIRAKNDHLLALKNFGDELTQARVNHRLAATDRDDGSPALVDGAQAFLDRQLLLDGRFILADPAASRARQIAGMKRLE